MNIPDHKTKIDWQSLDCWIKDARCYAVPDGAVLCKVSYGYLWIFVDMNEDGVRWWSIDDPAPKSFLPRFSQLREAWERCPTIDETTGKAAPKDWWPDGLYVAVEREVECGCENRPDSDTMYYCERCLATGTIKRLDLERVEERDLESTVAAFGNVHAAFKFLFTEKNIDAFFATDGTHEAVIKREDL